MNFCFTSAPVRNLVKGDTWMKSSRLISEAKICSIIVFWRSSFHA
jgi:hypothetical protein